MKLKLWLTIISDCINFPRAIWITISTYPSSKTRWTSSPFSGISTRIVSETRRISINCREFFSTSRTTQNLPWTVYWKSPISARWTSSITCSTTRNRKAISNTHSWSGISLFIVGVTFICTISRWEWPSSSCTSYNSRSSIFTQVIPRSPSTISITVSLGETTIS